MALLDSVSKVAFRSEADIFLGAAVAVVFWGAINVA